MYGKDGTRVFKPSYSGSDELRKGLNVEPRHSLSRTRMLSMNPKYVKTRSVCSILFAHEQERLCKHVKPWIDKLISPL
jgi:hypothetical protein